MTEKKELSTQKALKIRARAKRSKPAFVRPESWRYDKFSESWRRPRGLDNKIRRKIKGWPPAPSAGYKGPKAARGLHPSGFIEVVVHNVAELTGLNADTQAVRIGHTVGKRKRSQIVAEAKKLNLTLLNFKEIEEPAKEEEEAEGAEEKAETSGKKQEKETKEKPKEEEKPKKAAKKEEKPKKPTTAKKTKGDVKK
ncbi:MAG: 50S ribosomal protein L32e [Candidatus Bathyarchaeia archaeon]